MRKVVGEVVKEAGEVGCDVDWTGWGGSWLGLTLNFRGTKCCSEFRRSIDECN